MNLKIFTDDIEIQAKTQIENLLKQDAFKDCKIRIMPDVHAGAGCVIGFTGDLGEKVIPNIVGVDIGCGMLCVKLGQIELDLERLDNCVKAVIPNGNGKVHPFKKTLDKEWLKNLYCYDNLINKGSICKSLGSLGGGNHFIEIDVDKEDNKYLIIHTGSRNLGKQVCEIYQDLAYKTINNCTQEEYEKRVEEIVKNNQENKELISIKIKELKEEFNANENKIPKEFSYLEKENRESYLHDMKLCQEFATKNRELIVKLLLSTYFECDKEEIILKNMGEENIKEDNLHIFEYFETIHNYIDFEDNIVRKGSIKASKDKLVLIPLNMRDGCILGKGKGNEEWNNSAPHGAGRIMSRSEATKSITLNDYQESMKDIFTTSVCKETLDESPFAYKPSEEIIRYIEPTVEVIKILKPIYNFKAKN